jgi:TPR repeat protein
MTAYAAMPKSETPDRLCGFQDCGTLCHCRFDQWYADSRLRYDYGMTADREAALYWYRKAAEAGDRRAAFNLGLMLRDGMAGKPQPKISLALLRQAAEAGIPEADLALGNGYRLGLFGAVDTLAALAHYRAAAEVGLVPAQHALANMLADGLGIRPDLESAYTWWRIAAWKGATLSADALDRVDWLIAPKVRRRAILRAEAWLARH